MEKQRGSGSRGSGFGSGSKSPDPYPHPPEATRVEKHGLKSGLDTGNTLGYTKLGVNDEAATLQQIRTSFLNVVTTITGIYYNNIYPLIY